MDVDMYAAQVKVSWPPLPGALWYRVEFRRKSGTGPVEAWWPDPFKTNGTENGTTVAGRNGSANASLFQGSQAETSFGGSQIDQIDEAKP